MTDYGHDLAFGTFITPTSADPQTPVPSTPSSPRRWASTWRRSRTIPTTPASSTPSGPCSAGSRRRPAASPSPATSSTSRCGHPRCSPGPPLVTRPAVRWTDGPRAGCRCVLGRDRGDGCPATDTRPGGRCPERGHRRHPRPVGDRRATHGARRGRAPPGRRRASGTSAGPRRARLGPGAQAAPCCGSSRTKADMAGCPSLPYLQEGDLARGDGIIDAAAVAAGRDPSEVRRLLNVGAPTAE